MAAPIATASIGSTPRSASLPITVATNCLTMGILVGPPIKIILSTSGGDILASCIACIIGDLHLSTMGLRSSSSLALVIDNTRFFGPVVASYARKGKLISVVTTFDNSILAFSAASLILIMAAL